MKETYTALREFGSAFLGPALTVYARAVEKEAPGKLPVCLAREGWLLHQLLTHLPPKLGATATRRRRRRTCRVPSGLAAAAQSTSPLMT